MNDNQEIRNKKRKQWYDIDNEVYDYPMSCEALAMYNAICRFSNNESQKAYFSARKFMAHHKIGKAKYAAAKAELIGLGLISETGDKTKVGALYYVLHDVKSNPILTQPHPEADAAAPPVPTQPTNNTNPKPNKNLSVAKATETDLLNSEFEKACAYILEKTGCKIDSKEKWHRVWWYKAVKVDGLDGMKIAIKNFCHNKANVELGRWDWVSFLKIQAKRSNFLPKMQVLKSYDPNHGYKSQIRPELADEYENAGRVAI